MVSIFRHGEGWELRLWLYNLSACGAPSNPTGRRTHESSHDTDVVESQSLHLVGIVFQDINENFRWLN
jgi:hypothetical protein